MNRLILTGSISDIIKQLKELQKSYNYIKEIKK